MGTGDWQLYHNNAPTHASYPVQSFFGETSSHPSDSALPTHPPTAQIWYPFDFWLFPKLKSPLKGKSFRPLMRFRKIRQGSWWRLGELCEVPKCILWRGWRCYCPMYNVSYIFLKKCFYFSYYMTGYHQDRPWMFFGYSLPIPTPHPLRSVTLIHHVILKPPLQATAWG